MARLSMCWDSVIGLLLLIIIIGGHINWLLYNIIIIIGRHSTKRSDDTTLYCGRDTTLYCGRDTTLYYHHRRTAQNDTGLMKQHYKHILNTKNNYIINTLYYYFSSLPTHHNHYCCCYGGCYIGCVSSSIIVVIPSAARIRFVSLLSYHRPHFVVSCVIPSATPIRFVSSLSYRRPHFIVALPPAALGRRHTAGRTDPSRFEYYYSQLYLP